MDELKQLALSLDKSERRFFRDQALKHGEQDKPQYFALFEELEKDDAQYPVASNKHSVLRRYLRSQLLEALVGKHRCHSVELELRYLLDQIEVIQHRSLPKLLTKLILAGEKKAQEAGLPHYQALFLRHKRKLMRSKRDPGLLEEVKALSQMEKMLVSSSLEEVHMMGIYDHFYLTSQAKLSEETNLSKAAIDLPQKAPETFNGGLAYHSTLAMQATLVGDQHLAWHHFQNNLGVWHAFPRHIVDQPYRYIAAQINYLSACLLAGEYDRFQQSYSHLKSSPHLSELHQQILSLKALDLQLLFHLRKVEFTPLPILINTMADLLKEFPFDPVLELSAAFNLFLALFVQHQFKDSLRWLNHILDHPRGEERRDLRGAARILELIVHFELGNGELARYRLRMVKRIIKSWGLPAWTADLIKALRSRLDDPHGKEWPPLFEDLQVALKDADDQFPGHSAVNLWLDSQMTGMCMGDVLRKALSS